MEKKTEYLSGVERSMRADDILVSKTDLKGHITYANRAFIDISGYDERELIGAPHNLVRHPHMPRCVFSLLWERIQLGEEIFAYVVNRSKNGDHYWVLAHVTPSRDESGAVIGYHSSRRCPDTWVVTETIVPLYDSLLREERKHEKRKDSIKSGIDMIMSLLKQKGASYDELIFSLQA